ncbi:MAG: hypothetical protein H0T89_28580 [Deltaproteobacteria bacterium]|nr:hypothetical protein [Deltaproteobacteria bacterium]MDQ3300064.1 hypothetical protein [Myxococcota bacterium]
MGSARSKGGKASGIKAKASAVVSTRPVASRRGIAEVIIGGLIVLAGFLIAALAFDSASSSNGKLMVAYGPVIVGLAIAVRGGIRLSPPTATPLPPRPDVRRWIYGGLACLFALIQAFCLWKVIPNRLPGAWIHLCSFPVFTGLMAVGTLAGKRHGWWLAVLAGTGIVISLALAIVRILISAAFLAGVYGALGKAGATFSFVSIALMVEAVALLPIVQIKWLMSRSGRRVFGV